MKANLHGDQPVIHHHLLGEEVSSNSGLILITKFIIHILIHQRGLANSVEGKHGINEYKKYLSMLKV